MIFKKKAQKPKRFLAYLDLMNGILQLTQREREILAFLMELEGDHDLATIDLPSTDILSLNNRKDVVKKCNILRNNLPLMLKKFKDKGIIVVDESGRSRISKSIRPTAVDGKYKIEFEINFNDED